MRALLAIVLVAGLLAVSLPAAGDANYTERNMAYILELAGYETMPDEIIEVELNGDRVLMPASEAVHLAASLHWRSDLRSMAEHAIGGTVAVGDIAIHAYGCERVVPAQIAQPIWGWLGFQSFLASGKADNVLRCGPTYTTEWTTKMIQFFDGMSPATIAGNGSVIQFWGLTFGYINGVVVEA